MKDFISTKVNKCETHVSLLRVAQLCLPQLQLFAMASCKQNDSVLASLTERA